jgi:hypothetical protein
MLDSHPELAIPPETDFIPQLVAACEQAADPAQTCVDTLLAHWRLRDLQVDTRLLALEIRRLEPFSVGEALRVLYRTYAAKFGKARWGDKTPYYLGYMPLIASVLPEARFVHVIRDGRAVWQSIRSLWFKPGTVEETAAWWQKGIATGRRDGSLVPYLEVRYEDLVLEPERTLRAVCDFLELDWEPSMLDFHERAPARIAEVVTDYHENGRLVATVPERHRIHALTGSPPDGSRITAWREELPQEEIAAFESIAGETLDELGYLN